LISCEVSHDQRFNKEKGMSNTPKFTIEQDGKSVSVDMRIEEHGSSIAVNFKASGIKGMEDPTVSELRNIALSWAARCLLAQLPEGYQEGRPPFVPGPRKPQ
jgi:hypothetical protein